MQLSQIKTFIASYLSKYFTAGEVQAFLFGSSVREDKFFDVDVGLLSPGGIDSGKLAQLRFDLEESNFPYKVDLVDFSQTDQGFRDYVLNHKVIWLN